MLVGASDLYAHKLECFPHRIDSFPQPFGLIKKRYDDSDKDIRPCHAYRSVKEIMYHLEIKESMEMKNERKSEKLLTITKMTERRHMFYIFPNKSH